MLGFLFQNYFSSYETGQSVGLMKTGGQETVWLIQIACSRQIKNTLLLRLTPSITQGRYTQSN